MKKGGAVNMDELFTIEEMMSRLKVSRDTLYNWMNAGLIPYVQIGGRRRFIGSRVMKAIRNLETKMPRTAA